MLIGQFDAQLSARVLSKKLGYHGPLRPEDYAEALQVTLGQISSAVRRHDRMLGVGAMPSFWAALDYRGSEAGLKVESMAKALQDAMDLSNWDAAERLLADLQDALNEQATAKLEKAAALLGLGYLYHGTERKHFKSIQSVGLTPDYYGQRVYLSGDENLSRDYSRMGDDGPEGGLLLRAKLSDLPNAKKLPRTAAEIRHEHFISSVRISPDRLEYLNDNDQWLPLVDAPATDKLAKTAQPTMYHGTSSKRWAAMRSSGVIEARDGNSLGQGNGRPNSVYLSSDYGQAAAYADGSALADESDPVVLTVRLPQSQVRQLIGDETADESGMVGDDFRIEQHIPVNWVTRVDKLSDLMGKLAKGGDVSDVHFVTEKETDANWESWRIAALKPNGKEIGYITIERTGSESDDRYTVAQITVIPFYRHGGLATQLYEEAGKFAKAHGAKLYGSSKLTSAGLGLRASLRSKGKIKPGPNPFTGEDDEFLTRMAEARMAKGEFRWHRGSGDATSALLGWNDAHRAERRKDPLYGVDRVKLSPKQLLPTQEDYHDETVQDYVDNPPERSSNPAGDPRSMECPFVVQYKGQLWIMDGHHRTVAAIQRGDKKLDVNFLDLDNWEDPEEDDAEKLAKAKSDNKIAAAIQQAIDELKMSPYDINSGHCEELAQRVTELVPGAQVYADDFENDDVQHMFVYYHGKHYDSECLSGVKDYHQLPIFVRAATQKLAKDDSPWVWHGKRHSIDDALAGALVPAYIDLAHKKVHVGGGQDVAYHGLLKRPAVRAGMSPINSVEANFGVQNSRPSVYLLNGAAGPAAGLDKTKQAAQLLFDAGVPGDVDVYAPGFDLYGEVQLKDMANWQPSTEKLAKADDRPYITDDDGQPLEVYHGTKHNFKQFQLSRKRPSMQLGFGVHFSEDPKFSQDLYGNGPKGRTVQARLRASKVLDMDAPAVEGTEEYELAKEIIAAQRTYNFHTENDEQGRKSTTINLDMIHPNKAIALLRKYGYDAVRYTAKVNASHVYLDRNLRPVGDSGNGRAARSIVVLDPEQVESGNRKWQTGGGWQEQLPLDDDAEKMAKAKLPVTGTGVGVQELFLDYRTQGLIDDKYLTYGDVPLSELQPSQDEVEDERVTRYRDSKPAVNIDVARYGGQLYVVDGHHRVEAARQRGDKTISATTVDLDQLEQDDINGQLQRPDDYDEDYDYGADAGNDVEYKLAKADPADDADWEGGDGPVDGAKPVDEYDYLFDDEEEPEPDNTPLPKYNLSVVETSPVKGYKYEIRARASVGLIGEMVITYDKNNNRYKVENIDVAQGYRRKGLATTMYARAAALVKERGATLWGSDELTDDGESLVAGLQDKGLMDDDANYIAAVRADLQKDITDNPDDTPDDDIEHLVEAFGSIAIQNLPRTRQRVPIASLIAIQPDLDEEQVQHYLDNPKAKSVHDGATLAGRRRPWVVRYHGRMYIADGTHRTEAARRRGESDIEVGLTDLNDAERLQKNAAPIPDDIRAMTFYHGTKEEQRGQSILQSGQIRPGDEVGHHASGWLKPIKGKAYLTQSPGMATVYAIGGDAPGPDLPKGDKDEHGYVFEVSGNDLHDVQPDEDSVGIMAYDIAGPHPMGVPAAVANLPAWFDKAWIRSHLPENDWYTISGWKGVNYATETRIGKKLLKSMNDDEKFDLIRAGAHVAHTGAVPISAAHRVHKPSVDNSPTQDDDPQRWWEPLNLNKLQKEMRGPDERVWQGQQQAGPTALGQNWKLQQGSLGEALARRALEQHTGHKFHSINNDTMGNHTPLDLASDHMAVEVKTGRASVTPASRKWNVKLGQPSPQEKALMAQMSPDELREYNAKKLAYIMSRKTELAKQLSEKVGAPLQEVTVGVILDPDATHGDVYLIPGFHANLRWNKHATEENYIGTFSTFGGLDEQKMAKYGSVEASKQNIPDDLRGRTYYHGTDTEEAGQSILQAGYIDATNQPAHNAGSLSPTEGRAYLAHNIEAAGDYALSGDSSDEDMQDGRERKNASKHGYVFEVRGQDLYNIQPDENSLGEWAYGAINPGAANGHKIPKWLKSVVRQNATPEELRELRGPYSDLGVLNSVGKKVAAALTDVQKFEMIRLGTHIAHAGRAPISAAYRVNRRKADRAGGFGGVDDPNELLERIK